MVNLIMPIEENKGENSREKWSRQKNRLPSLGGVESM
jgi:hypothetical protein